MKDVLYLIIQSIVSNKEKVEISETISEKEIIYEVILAEEDVGRAIGRHGKMASAIRTVLNSFAKKERKRVKIRFVN